MRYALHTAFILYNFFSVTEIIVVFYENFITSVSQNTNLLHINIRSCQMNGILQNILLKYVITILKQFFFVI